MTFLFIHNDHLSPTKRAKETSSLIRGHARRHRLRRPSRRDEPRSSRAKRELKTLLPRNEEPTSNSQDEVPESENLFANPNGVIDILSDQALHFRMLQLDSEPRRLIQFYLSWNDSQAYSGSALSWAKWIVLAAFNNELNLLALPCYIASMVSYLRQATTSTQRKRSKDSGKASLFNYRSTSFDSYLDQASPQASQSPATSEYSAVLKATDISLFRSSVSCDLCENWHNDPVSHVAESYCDHNTPEVGELYDAWQFVSDTSLPEASDLAHLHNWHLEPFSLEYLLRTKHRSRPRFRLSWCSPFGVSSGLRYFKTTNLRLCLMSDFSGISYSGLMAPNTSPLDWST